MMKGPGFVPTFLYYFVGSTFVAFFVLSHGANPDLALASPWGVAIAFGILSGLVGGSLNGHTTVQLPVNNTGDFTKKLQAVLIAQGYQETERVEAVTVYQRSDWTKMLAGKILVQLEPNTAQISGRSTHIKAIQKQLSKVEA
jgi:hypothetical protein